MSENHKVDSSWKMIAEVDLSLPQEHTCSCTYINTHKIEIYFVIFFGHSMALFSSLNLADDSWVAIFKSVCVWWETRF